MEVTKDTKIGELLMEDFACSSILMGAGMHCVGCPSSAMESLEDACMVHGMEVDDVLYSINEYLRKKEEKQTEVQ